MDDDSEEARFSICTPAQDGMPDSLSITGRSRFVSSSGAQINVEHLLEEGQRTQYRLSLWRLQEQHEVLETMLYHHHGGCFCVFVWGEKDSETPVYGKVLSRGEKNDFFTLLEECVKFREETRVRLSKGRLEVKKKAKKTSARARRAR